MQSACGAASKPREQNLHICPVPPVSDASDRRNRAVMHVLLPAWAHFWLRRAAFMVHGLHHLSVAAPFVSISEHPAVRLPICASLL